MDLNQGRKRQADDDLEVITKRGYGLEAQPELEQEKTTFMDLSNDNLIQIMKYLDPVTRFNLRMTKRLNRLLLCFSNKMERMELKISSNDGYELSMIPSTRPPYYRSNDFDGLVKGLNRLAANTHFGFIYIALSSFSSEQYDRIVDAFSTFQAGELKIHSVGLERIYLPQVNFSTLLTFAQNLREVNIGITCTSVTARDLCYLRKKMLKCMCKLESFSIEVRNEVIDSFIDKCFGVTIESSAIRGRTYRIFDKSIKLYYDNLSRYDPPLLLYHYKEDLETKAGPGYLAVKTCKGGAKPDRKYKKVRISGVYSYW